MGMFYVYRIQSIDCPDRFYTGFTEDLKQRVLEHNRGRNISTATLRPWKLVFYSAFEENEMALEFERYLKSGSGKAFARKRLWKSNS